MMILCTGCLSSCILDIKSFDSCYILFCPFAPGYPSVPFTKDLSKCLRLPIKLLVCRGCSDKCKVMIETYNGPISCCVYQSDHPCNWEDVT